MTGRTAVVPGPGPAAGRRLSSTRRTVLLAAATLAALTACSGPRGGLPLNAVSRDAGSCAAVLPLAQDSVGHRGTLIAIHPLHRGEADTILRAMGHSPAPGPAHPRQTAPPSHHPANLPKTCVVAYQGAFTAGEVALAPTEHGRYAVVILNVRHPAVRQLVLTDRLPPGV